MAAPAKYNWGPLKGKGSGDGKGPRGRGSNSLVPALKVWRLINSTPSIDTYLPQERSGQISSRFDLKRQTDRALRFFEERRQQQEKSSLSIPYKFMVQKLRKQKRAEYMTEIRVYIKSTKVGRKLLLVCWQDAIKHVIQLRNRIQHRVGRWPVTRPDPMIRTLVSNSWDNARESGPWVTRDENSNYRPAVSAAQATLTSLPMARAGRGDWQCRTWKMTDQIAQQLRFGASFFKFFFQVVQCPVFDLFWSIFFRSCIQRRHSMNSLLHYAYLCTLLHATE